ncbi:Metal tolerance protein C2, putative [Pediculus humanus corporis]|uniref:Metal tolerance protein C2, putative n=1 Tax=Pediculus humanus subsp. corporis TaxID=121224 RepID=E0VNF6_PEDHC|nr:Metal tolerance protein C2, putative [Pediculus humanus corporis]EEB14912.1 Metal tolerance protein C2, putative [Pediculus humanus corporis]
MLPVSYKDATSRMWWGNRLKESIQNFCRLIISEKSSRNLFLFLLLNLSFAFIELFYGYWTNSLGLISDSFHMFFDCSGLLAGILATVVTRKKPNEKYSYGYVRAEVLAGFCNALFLLFTAGSIFFQAIERALEPPEVKHERLFVVSVLGFLVNLIGIYAFQHGHSHSVFLHILADTLGSVGVIVSSLLMQYFGWMIADPICSIFIAILITASIYPLIKDSYMILMQRQPVSLDHVLPQCYNKVMQLAGVYSVQEPHFWTLCSNTYVGGIKLEVSKSADHKYIIRHTHMIFAEIGIKQLYVQLDFPSITMTVKSLEL